MKKFLTLIILSFLTACASTAYKSPSQLIPDSNAQANIYIKRLGGYVLGGTRAIIEINGQELGSINTNEYLKVYANPGNNIFTVAGDIKSGVFGKTDTSMNYEAGKNYYYVVSVSGGKGLGIFLGGAIGQAVTGGPFQVLQVDKNSYYWGNAIPVTTNNSTTNTRNSSDNQAGSSGKNLTDEIQQLNKLYKSGALTAEEYRKAKAKILE